MFFVLVNVSGAERECSGCGSRAFIADSAECWNEESWEDDEPGAAGCPCGSEEFEAVVAFSLGDDGSVRWVTMGPAVRQARILRCLCRLENRLRTDGSPPDYGLGLRSDGPGRLGFVERSVAEHGEQDVRLASGEAEQSRAWVWCLPWAIFLS